MDEHIRKHIEQVREWLEKKVQKYPTPCKVTLSEFEVDWDELSGAFSISFDAVPLPKKLKFGVEQSGKAVFFLPMFHSPLGAPASYATIEISDKTSRAILKGLHSTIPRVKGYGINRETGKQIYSHTPICERIINHDEFWLAKKRIESDGYTISIDTEIA